MKLKFQLARKAGAWWIYRRKWFVRLFWLNCILWFWPVYLGHGIYKEVIAPQEVSYAQITKLETSALVPMPEGFENAIEYFGQLYGVNIEMLKNVFNCESKMMYQVGDTDKLYWAYGPAQFQRRTFYEFAEKYKLRNADIDNEIDQALLSVMMIRDGYGEKWTCYRRLILNEKI